MSVGASSDVNYGYADNRPDADWPSKGVIEYDKVSVRYSETLPPVLNKLSFRTKSAEKVGIVGRTGAVRLTFLMNY